MLSPESKKYIKKSYKMIRNKNVLLLMAIAFLLGGVLSATAPLKVIHDLEKIFTKRIQKIETVQTTTNLEGNLKRDLINEMTNFHDFIFDKIFRTLPYYAFLVMSSISIILFGAYYDIRRLEHLLKELKIDQEGEAV